MPSMAWVATWDAEARQRLFAAADTLAHRLGTPAIDREARASRDPLPTPKSVGDMEAMAILAEAAVRLSEEVDELRRQLVRTKTGGKP